MSKHIVVEWHSEGHRVIERVAGKFRGQVMARCFARRLGRGKLCTTRPNYHRDAARKGIEVVGRGGGRWDVPWYIGWSVAERGW